MMIFKYKFVEYIPDSIDVNTMYISMTFSTAIHLCACGCGKEVVTPFSPTDWEIRFNGKNISFYPSIGNWNFECKSHYWIRKNEIIFAPKWSEKEIKENRKKDEKKKNDFYYNSNLANDFQHFKDRSINDNKLFQFLKLIKVFGKKLLIEHHKLDRLR
ncbi:MAG: DUF6527 family protein [Sphingobacteriia bacterium]